jgi:hypothetical protein
MTAMMSDERIDEPGALVRQGLPNRRELGRLARHDRDERRRRGERTRERLAREQKRAWHERDRPTLRTSVWRELRDEQWAIVDIRERQAADQEAPEQDE